MNEFLATGKIMAEYPSGKLILTPVCIKCRAFFRKTNSSGA
jgi:hypothetical protein